MNGSVLQQLEAIRGALDFRSRGLLESRGRIEIYSDGGGFREVFPDPYNQTYDSHLLAGAGNGKTVMNLAREALRVLFNLQGTPGARQTAREVFNFVDNYVMKHAGKRARAVRWNSKSYPD